MKFVFFILADRAVKDFSSAGQPRKRAHHTTKLLFNRFDTGTLLSVT